MAKSKTGWVDMTAEERKTYSAEQKAQAIKAIETQGFPTGLKVTVGGKEFIARPMRQAETGGVTYGITPRPATAGKYSARFNKFSFTLMGEEVSEASFDTEELL